MGAEEALFELNVKKEGVQKRNESEAAHLNHKKMISKKRARMGLIRQESSMDEEHPGSDLVVSEGMVMMTSTIVDTAGGEGATKKITTLAPPPKKNESLGVTETWQHRHLSIHTSKERNSGKDTRSRKETRQKWKRQCHPDQSVKLRLRTSTVSSKRNLRERRRML